MNNDFVIFIFFKSSYELGCNSLGSSCQIIFQVSMISCGDLLLDLKVLYFPGGTVIVVNPFGI